MGRQKEHRSSIHFFVYPEGMSKIPEGMGSMLMDFTSRVLEKNGASFPAEGAAFSSAFFCRNREANPVTAPAMRP